MTKPNPTCRGCGDELTPANDSAAHVIPNALGGHLSPKGIICQTCNTKLDALADNALIEAFGDWPTLLDIPRDRGKNPPKIMATRNGSRVRAEPDGSLTRVDVVYDVEPTEDGHKVQIAAGDMKTFKQLLQRAAKQFPQFDAKTAEQYARTVGIEDGDLKTNLDFSPAAVFGGVVTAVWLFLIEKAGRAFMDWPRLLTVISEVQKHGGGWRYMVEGLPGLRGPEIPLIHKIVVRSLPSTGELIAYVEILGILKIGGLFAKASGPVDPLNYIYVYDVLGRVERSDEFSIDGEEFEKTNWKTVGLGPTDVNDLKSHFVQAINDVFVARYQARFAKP